MIQHLINLIRFLYTTRYLHYAAIGVFGSGLNIGATYALTEWASIYYMTSYAMATLATWAIMFNLHSRITFRGHEKTRQHVRFIKFISVYGAAFAVNFLFIYLLTEKFHIYYLASIAFVTITLSVGTFLLNKSRVFKK